MDRDDIENLLTEVEERLEEEPDSLTYEDAEERLHLLLYLYGLLQEARENRRKEASFEHSDETDFRYIKLRNSLKEIDRLGYIDTLNFALGGNGFFQIVDLVGYQKWIETELEKIKKRINEPEEEAKKEVRDEEESEIVEELESFCSFVEENGFKAFWDNGFTSGEIRQSPEEIGRCELMAFLASKRGYSAREVFSGEGRQDIVYIEDLIPAIFEVKVFKSKNTKRYDEGITQLVDYTENQDTDKGYYVIFQKGEIYENKEFNVEGIQIIQRCANIKPEPPTG